MRLNKIEFKNFRCFYGQQELDLPHAENAHVTIIHAQNGVGKTNLLNAILWTFYNKTTGKFEQEDRILNFDAEQEGDTTAYVQIEFSFYPRGKNSARNYRAIRYYDKSNHGKKKATQFKMWEIESDGNQRALPNPELFIETILPSEMAQYFFFDGEYAETFSGENNSTKIGEAVKRILGCEIAERAISDLKKAKKKYERQIRTQLADGDTINLSDEIVKIEEEISVAQSTIKKNDTHSEKLLQNIEDVSERLRKNEASKELQKTYEETEHNLKLANDNLKLADKEYHKWVDLHALPLLSEKVIDKAKKVIAKNKKVNKIPSKYSGPLIDELLENNECICGSTLKSGTPAHDKIKALKTQASDDDQIDRYSRVIATFKLFIEKKETSEKQLVQLIKIRQDAKNEISTLESIIEGLNKNYAKIDDAEINRLREDKTRKQSEYKSLISNIGKLKADIKDKEDNIIQKKKQLDQAVRSQNAGNMTLRKKDKLDIVIKHIEKELNNHIKVAVEVITKDVNDFLEVAANKSMKISLNEDFELTVKFANGESLPKSGGENQLISLVFTAALVNHAELRSGHTGKLLLPGTVAPLVLDAPFGQLDQDYQVQISKLLPDFSKQLVLLLSNSQGNKKVLDVLRPYVGSEFIIIRKNKNSQKKEQPNHEININGKSYIRVMYNQNHDCSEIMRVV